MKAAAAKRSPLAAAWGWCRGNPHFLVALVFLAATAGTIRLFKWVEKLPVPWPEGVEVNENFQMTSLPKKFGNRFVMVEKDPNNQKSFVGERVIEESVLKDLSIGTYLDEQRRPKRCSNWYVARVYRDTESGENGTSLYSYWLLEVYYYTGVRDKVPHVPERCLRAGGVEVLDSLTVEFTAPAARPPWDEPIEFRRTHYGRFDRTRDTTIEGTEYYVFSLNGEPTNDWKNVRFKLSMPLVTYSYFAKIQFAPMGRINSVAEADRRAQEFIREALPEIINTLPSAEYVESLSRTKEDK